jgi:hypothetical protein
MIDPKKPQQARTSSSASRADLLQPGLLLAGGGRGHQRRDRYQYIV